MAHIDEKVYHLLAGAGLEPILMPRSQFIKEHKNLLKVLKSNDPKQLRKEYAEQKAELDQQLRGDGKGKSYEGVSEETKAYLTSVGKKEKGTKSHQQTHAQFYTPKVLKDKAFEGIDIPKDEPVLEPTYGSGEFLEALLERGYSNITGVEYDPVVFGKFKDKWESKGVKVYNGDYLMATFPQKFKLVIGNPPYFLMKGKNAMTEEQKKFYRPYFKGVPDIYVMATIKGIMDLDDGGILSFVIPTSLLTSPQHQLARNFIHKNCSIVDIYVHPDRKAFAGADVEVMVFKVQKTATPDDRFIKTIGKNVIFSREEESGAEVEGAERIKDLVQFKVGPLDISKIVDKDNLSGERTADTLPIIYGENINNNELRVDGAIKKGRAQYIKATYEPKKQIDAPFIVIKRTIGTGKAKAFKCAMVEEGKFYCENHTFYGKGTPENLRIVFKVLSDPEYQKEWLKDVNGLAISGTFINDIPIPPALRGSGQSRKAGFVQRMMAEVKLKHDGEYRKPTAPLSKQSTMKAPVAFSMSKLPSASPFIIHHFGTKAQQNALKAQREVRQKARDERIPKPSKKVLQSVAKAVKIEEAKDKARDERLERSALRKIDYQVKKGKVANFLKGAIQTKRAKATHKPVSVESKLEAYLEGKTPRQKATIRQRVRYWTSGDERPPVPRDEAILRVIGEWKA